MSYIKVLGDISSGPKPKRPDKKMAWFQFFLYDPSNNNGRYLHNFDNELSEFKSAIYSFCHKGLNEINFIVSQLGKCLYLPNCETIGYWVIELWQPFLFN